MILPGAYRSVAAPTLIVAAFVALAWLAMQPPVPASSFVSLMAAAWLGYALFFRSPDPSPFILRWATACAIAVRVVGVWSHPIYEDDWARYLWDGLRFLKDGTPYGIPPTSFLDDTHLDASWREVLGQVNNPDIPTIYAPTLQYIFAASAWVAPASLTVLKSIFVGFDLGVWIVITWLGGKLAGMRYALCPLVIFEISFNAHADVVGVFLIMACFAFLKRDRLVRGGVAFGLALACKPFAIIIAPCFFRDRWHVPLPIAGAVLFAIYGPFLYQGATERAGLQAFAKTWEFNSLGFALLKDWLGNPEARQLGFVLGSLISGLLIVRWLRSERSSIPPADTWLSALLFFAPVINPWYLLWAVPWASLRPNPMSWSIFPAVSISYLTGGVVAIADLGFYDHPAWVRPLEVLTAFAIYVALVWIVPSVSMQSENTEGHPASN